MIRNIAVQHEDRLSQLRINFNIPGKSNKHANVYPIDVKGQAYISEMLFRTSHRQHYNDLLSTYKNLLKEFNPLVNMVNNGPALIENTGRKPALDDLLLRPQISGKKTVGRLELHKNGFRFKSRKVETLDILIENVKHAIYMPADEEDIFILHFQFNEPLIYSGKRVHHLQCYTQLDSTNDDIVDSTAKRRKFNRSNFESVADESDDKVFTQRLTKVEAAFEGFIRAVEAESKKQIIFEEPDLDTGFLASVDYNEVRVYLSDNCVFALTTHPYLIIPFHDLEFVVFERVGMINRTFDLAFIFKDYSRPVINITNVSSSHRPDLKRSFDSKDVIVFESNLNLKWGALLKKFSEDIESFIDDGGWQYLGDKDSGIKRARLSDEDDSEASDYSSFTDGGSEEGYSDSDDDEDEESSDDDQDEDEYEFSDPDDAFSSEDDNDDDFEEDSQDSLIVRKKGEPKVRAANPKDVKGRGRK